LARTRQHRSIFRSYRKSAAVPYSWPEVARARRRTRPRFGQDSVNRARITQLKNAENRCERRARSKPKPVSESTENSGLASYAGTLGAIAFVYISLYEGFGLPVLEAMACDTPCLVSDRGAMAEVVADAALKVDPTAMGMIEEGLYWIINDTELALSLCERGNRRAHEFSWKRASDLALEVPRAYAGCGSPV
jgi:glycosyltransferase involved in cell wall biosynthesis